MTTGNARQAISCTHLLCFTSNRAPQRWQRTTHSRGFHHRLGPSLASIVPQPRDIFGLAWQLGQGITNPSVVEPGYRVPENIRPPLHQSADQLTGLENKGLNPPCGARARAFVSIRL